MTSESNFEEVGEIYAGGVPGGGEHTCMIGRYQLWRRELRQDGVTESNTTAIGSNRVESSLKLEFRRRKEPCRGGKILVVLFCQ